jgi:hypothetical protein
MRLSRYSDIVYILPQKELLTGMMGCVKILRASLAGGMEEEVRNSDSRHPCVGGLVALPLRTWAIATANPPLQGWLLFRTVTGENFRGTQET